MIQFQHVTKQYEGHTALKEVSFSIKKGTIFGLLGPNGAGKTTLLRILTRILLPDSGQVMFDNQPLSEHHIRRIGYLPEERGLYPRMKAGEHLVFLAGLKGLSTRKSKENIAYWAHKLELETLLDRKVEALSKGQQQKVQLIAALVHEPDFIILDEPFSGFDPVNAELLKEVIFDLKKAGRTLLISTHRMENAEEICDEVTLLNKGQLVMEGTLDAVLKDQRGLFFKVVSDRPLFSNAFFDVIDTKHDKTILKSKEGVGYNQVLHSLLEQAEIHSFLEERKTLKEVFLEKVRG